MLNSSTIFPFIIGFYYILFPLLKCVENKMQQKSRESEHLLRQQARLRLATHVERLCSEIASVTLQLFFPHQPPSATILQLPTQSIEQWVCKTRHKVKLSKQFIKQQLKNKKIYPSTPFSSLKVNYILEH
jgi:hypothetical protein